MRVAVAARTRLSVVHVELKRTGLAASTDHGESSLPTHIAQRTPNGTDEGCELFRAHIKPTSALRENSG